MGEIVIMRGATFGKIDRFKLINHNLVPGPGNYKNEKVLVHKQSSPSLTFGKSPMAQDVATPN